VKDRFFAERETVRTALAQVNASDGRAKDERLLAEGRWRLHQQVTGPVMERLHRWLKEPIEQRQLKPNSALDAAVEYRRQH